MIRVMMLLESAEYEELYLPRIGGWHLLRESVCPYQTGHNDMAILETQCQGLYEPVARSEAIYLLHGFMSKMYVHHLMAEKE